MTKSDDTKPKPSARATADSDHASAEAGTYPVLPLRDIVVFPHMVVPLFVGREKSIRALEEVMRADNHILLVTQREAGDDDPKPAGLFEIGTFTVPSGSFRSCRTLARVPISNRPAGLGSSSPASRWVT
ncbi:MAG: LON peptidase substrate-binding domain-containing protein, partial [Pseudomonadota bacterium]